MSKSKIDILESLNPEQRQAVEATEGPVLVLAGAGSGKTRVLTHRMAHIIQEGLAAPWEILAMTFTNKAAGEMKERVSQLVAGEQGMWVGTFHSIFAKILRWEAAAFGYSSDFVIYDTDDQQRLIKMIMEDFHVSVKQYAPKSVQSVISKLKNSLIFPESYIPTKGHPFEAIVAQVYPAYENRLRKNHAFDFDDLITVPIRLFTEYPKILKKYQSRFKYLLVDEYQDTNRAQYQLVHQLAQANKNICVVGDDDQSIYRWRGADLRNILDFEKDFPDTRVFRLEQNYRSTQTILQAANSVIEKNEGRKGKTLWSDRKGGDNLLILEVQDEREEAHRVVERIKDEVFKGKRTFREFAILYRTNAQSRSLEEGLRRSGMNYIIVGGIRFYERKEVKDVLAYLKLIANPKDSISLYRIINFPLRGIGDTTLTKIQTWATEQGIDDFQAMGRVEEIQEISTRIQKSVKGFYDLIQKYIDIKDEISPNELAHTVVDETGLLAMYKEDSTVEGQGRAENIREFLNAITEYTESVESPTLSGFLEEVSLISDVDNWNDKSNAITLMTLHCAKGLEFPVVFITGLEEGLFPVSRSEDDPEAIEEERRLFYVGITRAEDKVYLLWAERRRLYNDTRFRMPSRFLDELDLSVIKRERTYHKRPDPAHAPAFRRKSEPTIEYDRHPDYENESQEYLEYSKGAQVKHDVFGIGHITNVEGTGRKKKVIVLFQNGVEKKFLLQYANFEML